MASAYVTQVRIISKRGLEDLPIANCACATEWGGRELTGGFVVDFDYKTIRGTSTVECTHTHLRAAATAADTAGKQ